MKYYSLIIGFSFLLFLLNCSSVNKYNETISAKHSIPEMQEDVGVAYIHLQKYHPRLYQYISKEELDYSFDSLKNSFTQPLDSKEFAYALTTVVGKVGQAHNRVVIPNKKYTKKEYKEMRKYEFDLNNIDFDIANDTVFVSRNITKDSVLSKAQVLAINDEPVNTLINRYLTYVNSDGYNQTFRKKIIAQRLGYYYSAENGRQDSLQVTFQNSDSIWTHTFRRELKKKKQKKELMDSVKEQLKDINNSKQRFIKEETPESKKEARKKRKSERKYENIHGYNRDSKLYNREFSFIGEDSTVGYLKIRSFTSGNYKKFYENTFQKIDSAQIQNLIIDVRDNTGGRLNEIDELYSYLIDEDYVFLNPSQVTKRGSFYRSLMGNSGKAAAFFIGIFTPVVYPYLLTKTKKDDEGNIYYKFSNSKENEPKDNNFKGNIYYIVNGTSFSASSVLATKLDELPNVTVVGEEAGGDYNGTVAGMFNRKKLPNTNVSLRNGIFYIDTPVKRDEIGRGIYPDVNIQTSYSEFLQDQDSEVEWILKDISTKTQSTDSDEN